MRPENTSGGSLDHAPALLPSPYCVSDLPLLCLMIIVAISQLEGTMVFCSHRFIFAFFPIVFAGYWIIARFVGHRASKVG